MASWRKTRTPGVYVAHSKSCPALSDAEARCRCRPSWRGRRWNAQAGRAEWQSPSTKDRAEVLSWLAASRKGAQRIAEAAAAGWTFEAIGDAWLDGVEAGRIGRRRGRGKPYSETTIEDYRRSYRHYLRPEFGPMVADEIGELEWQMWVDRLSREGLSRSRIAGHSSVASAIYAWASARAGATRPAIRFAWSSYHPATRSRASV